MATSSMCNGSRSWIACWVRFSTFDSCFFFLLSPTICCARSNSFCISFRLPANARAPLSLVRSMAALFHISFNFLVLDGARGDCGTRTMNSSPSAALAQHHFCNMLCLLFFRCLFFRFVEKPNLCFFIRIFEIRCHLLYNSLIRGRNAVVCHSWPTIVSVAAPATVIESRQREKEEEKEMFVYYYFCCLLLYSRNANCVRNYRIKLAFYCRFSASVKAISWMFITFLREILSFFSAFFIYHRSRRSHSSAQSEATQLRLRRRNHTCDHIVREEMIWANIN